MAHLEHFRIPGISMALIKDHQIVYHRGLGVKDLHTKDPVEPDTLFEAASMTKPMFAYAVCRLVDRGILDLDKPLCQYLPYEDIAHDPRYKQITARMVLCHRTGFPNWRTDRLELLFDPGTQQGYSGEGFEYLGKVVSHLTNKSITDVMRDEVFHQLGIHNTHLTWAHTQHPAAAMPHDSGVVMPKSTWDAPWVAGCLHIDAGNYANFLIGIAQQKGLTPETYRKFLEPQVAAEQLGDGQNFALGFRLLDTHLGTSFGHGGRNVGFTSNSEMISEHGIGFVFLMNIDEEERFTAVLRSFLFGTAERRVAGR